MPNIKLRDHIHKKLSCENEIIKQNPQNLKHIYRKMFETIIYIYHITMLSHLLNNIKLFILLIQFYYRYCFTFSNIS